MDDRQQHVPFCHQRDRLEIALDESGKHYLVWGGLRRGEEQLDLTEPVLLVKGGLVFWNDRVAPLKDFGAFDWITLLLQPKLTRTSPINLL